MANMLMKQCSMSSHRPFIFPSNWDLSFLDEPRHSPRRASSNSLPTVPDYQNTPVYQNVGVDKLRKRRLVKSDSEDSGYSDESSLEKSSTRTEPAVVRSDQSPPSIRACSVNPRLMSDAAEVARQRLLESGFYFGQISASEARHKLARHPPGTFLVRESSDQRYLCALTVRLASDSSAKAVTTSVRIEMLSSGLCRLDGDPYSPSQLPEFPCVLELLRHHMGRRRGGREGDGKQPYVFLELSGNGGEQPMELRRPLYREQRPSSLRHLCRLRINGLLEGRSVDRLPVVPSLNQYLKEYPCDF